jgi:hypothetical protein
MPSKKLSETKIKKLSKPGIYSDGDGLYLRVRAGGSKQWFFIYKRDGKRTELGLGGYGTGTAPVDLELAREKADDIRKKLARGEKLDERPTFSSLIDDVIAVETASSTNERHIKQWGLSLRIYAKALHRKPVESVTRADVVAAIKPIWSKTPTTARRTLGRIAAVFDHAKAKGLFTGDNPAAWEGGGEQATSRTQEVRY